MIAKSGFGISSLKGLSLSLTNTKYIVKIELIDLSGIYQIKNLFSFNFPEYFACSLVICCYLILFWFLSNIKLVTSIYMYPKFYNYSCVCYVEAKKINL